MTRWSLASGSPPFGAAPTRGPPSASVADAERAARRSVAFWGALLAAGVALPFLPTPVPPLASWSIFAIALLGAPLGAASRTRALGLAMRAAGRLARGPRLRIEALARGDDLLEPAPWRRLPQGLALSWLKGIALPLLLVADLLSTPLARGDRIRAAANLDELTLALSGAGAHVEREGARLLVKLPPTHDGDTARPVRLRARRLSFPFPADVLDARGEARELRRLRRLLEGPLAHHLVFTASDPARRWERRLNALAREAEVASTLEERSLLLEETERLRRALDERTLGADEWSLLALKESRLRALLSQRLLSEPPGMRHEGRALAPLPALAPELARVLDAGGLANLRRVVFVPHWIVPVETPWGEQEACIHGATGRFDAAESRALLAAMRARGPGLLVETGAQPQFLPHAPPTAALLREMRAAGLRIPPEVATGATPADVVYVPYLAGPEGYVNGVTGAPAPDLGAAVPEAQGPFAKP